jgi:hypothetical protein
VTKNGGRRKKTGRLQVLCPFFYKMTDFFPVNHINNPSYDSIDISEVVSRLKCFADSKYPCPRDVVYWSGDNNPWKMGVFNEPIVDQRLIEEEEEKKKEIELEDLQNSCGSSDLFSKGVSVTFLLALTFELDLWEWKTWEVVKYLVKPSTIASNRCRFSDLPYIKPFTGNSTVFVSHCWGSKWGDLIGAVCSGASMKRMVWLDVFAVRQWPGNGHDLDFRGIIEKCNSLILVTSPIKDNRLSIETFSHEQLKREAYMQTGEYDIARQLLPFFRLWCIVELFAAISFSKPIVLKCSNTQMVADPNMPSSSFMLVSGGNEARNSMNNISFMIDVSTAQCAVQEDKIRELRYIGTRTQEVNQKVTEVVRAAVWTSSRMVTEIDSVLCGEVGALDRLTDDRVSDALSAACSYGMLDAVNTLLSKNLVDLKADPYPLWKSASVGSLAVVATLIKHGADVNHLDRDACAIAVQMDMLMWLSCCCNMGPR